MCMIWSIYFHIYISLTQPITESQMKIPVIAHLLLILGTAQGGYAPRESPKLPDGFCPKETGTITETTGGKEE